MHTAINDSGQIVGFYNDGSLDHGFVYSDGVFYTVDVPGASQTLLYGINDMGQISGTWEASRAHGFVKDGVHFKSYLYPGSLDTRFFGINDDGELVGVYDGSGYPAPEPSTLLLLSSGALGIFASLKARAKIRVADRND